MSSKYRRADLMKMQELLEISLKPTDKAGRTREEVSPSWGGTEALIYPGDSGCAPYFLSRRKLFKLDHI